MSLRRSTVSKKAKKSKVREESSSSADADLIVSESVSSEEPTSGTESVHSETPDASVFDEDTADSSESSYNSVEDFYRRGRRNQCEVRYVYLDRKGRPCNPPPLQFSPYSEKKSKNGITKRSDKKKKRSSSSSSKHSDKKDKKKKSSKSSKKSDSSKRKKPATPRKRKDKSEKIINESDPAHIKLAKSIPDDIVSKLNLSSETTIAHITERVMERDNELFDKLTEACFLIKKANFTIGLPSANVFTYGDLYVCVVEDGNTVTRLERCFDMKHDDMKLRRLPLSFEKRTTMLELFNKRSPKEIQEEYAKSSHKDKAVSRINFLLNDNEDGGLTLSIPTETDPCSEVCILKSDGSDDTPIKVACIWQASVIREKNLICVKPKSEVSPSKAEIDKVVLARLSLTRMLNEFIDSEESSSKSKKSSENKKSPSKKSKPAQECEKEEDSKKNKKKASEPESPAKRKREEPAATATTKPEKKAKIEEPVKKAVETKKEESSHSSTSTSSSSEEEMSEEPPKIQKESSSSMPLWEPFIKEAKTQPPVEVKPVVETPSLRNHIEKTSNARTALLAEFRKTQTK